MQIYPGQAPESAKPTINNSAPDDMLRMRYVMYESRGKRPSSMALCYGNGILWHGALRLDCQSGLKLQVFVRSWQRRLLVHVEHPSVTLTNAPESKSDTIIAATVLSIGSSGDNGRLRYGSIDHCMGATTYVLRSPS